MARYFIYFIFYSFIGWSYESALYSIRQGRFVNSGMLCGCICPIYGLGALMEIFLFAGSQSSVMIFVGAAASASVLEYASSWLIERLFGARWWDYGDWPANINGRISLLSSAAFGLMSVMLVRVLHPAFASMADRLSDRTAAIIAAALFLALTTDMLISANRLHKMPKKEEISIVLKLPFDFMPKISVLKAQVKGVSATVASRSEDILEYIAECLAELLQKFR